MLDTLYSAGIMRAVRDNAVIHNRKAETTQAENGLPTFAKEKEALVLNRWNGKLISKALDIPELEVELDRAIWQVETALKGKEELMEEKEDLDKATTVTDSKDKNKK